MHYIVIDYDMILESIHSNHERSKRCLQEREREMAMVVIAGCKCVLVKTSKNQVCQFIDIEPIHDVNMSYRVLDEWKCIGLLVNSNR